MEKVLFVCAGNTGRSPMAEFVMKNLVARHNLSEKIFVDSAGTQAKDGEPIVAEIRAELERNSVPLTDKLSRKITDKDFADFTYIVAIDKKVFAKLQESFGAEKVFLLMKFAGEDTDPENPFSHGNYEKAFADILRGCEGLLNFLQKN